MPPISEPAVERMRSDHEHMLRLIQKILDQCNQRDKIDSCNHCHSSQQGVCHGNIEQMIRTFVDMTLKHNLLESMHMQEIVPPVHRIAHNQAHMDIAQQLKAIRVVFTGNGNGIKAIEGIDRVHQTLLAHFRDYDQQLESYLSAAAGHC